MIYRCSWCQGNELYEAYHDQEWGIPTYDNKQLFENLTLEGAQAGLSWLTILRKREGYHQLFCNWDIERIAKFSDADLNKICQNPAVVRHKQKIYSVRTNAIAALRIKEEFGSLANYFWQFVDNTPVVNTPKSESSIPAETPLSKTISKDLKLRGFTFVGSKTVYAFMQASGLVNDHVANCWKAKAT